MLVLTRHLGEEVVIDGNIRIMVTEVRGDRVRLGITAPESMRVNRAEVEAHRLAPGRPPTTSPQEP